MTNVWKKRSNKQKIQEIVKKQALLIKLWQNHQLSQGNKTRWTRCTLLRAKLAPVTEWVHKTLPGMSGVLYKASSHAKHTLGKQNPTTYAANFSQSSAISGTATTAANFSQSLATSGMDVRIASQVSSHANTHTGK